MESPRATRLILGILATGSIASACRTEPQRPTQGRLPVDAQPTGDCVLDDRGGVCTAGGCTIVVPPVVLSQPTPIQVARIPVPPEVADALKEAGEWQGGAPSK